MPKAPANPPRAQSADERPTVGAREVGAQIANPPASRPRTDPGASQHRAQQAGEVAIGSDALDAAGIAAHTDDLPFVVTREAQARTELAAIAGERAESEMVGVALETAAARGSQVEPKPGTRTNSRAGIAAETAEAEQKLAAEEEALEVLQETLAGARPHVDGTRRPGNRLAIHAKNLRRALLLVLLGLAAVVIAPIVIEGYAVTHNMHAYLRADDADWMSPAFIAAITVGILTLAPYVLGVAVNDLAHGATKHVLVKGLLVAIAVFWVGVGVTLACVRVQVDRAEAIRAAEERRRAAIGNTQGLGESIDIPEVDPGAVFDPVLPTIFWIVVFVGFGMVLIAWEAMHRNPVQVQELRQRILVADLRDRVIALHDQADALAASVIVQREVNRLTLVAWDAEHEVVAAAAAHDTAVYYQTLGEASGDPQVPLAVSQHRSTVAARGAAKAAPALESHAGALSEGADTVTGTATGTELAASAEGGQR